MDDKLDTNYIFSQEQISNFVNLYNTLKAVHARLIKKGYIIDKNNLTIIPPDDLPSQSTMI